MTGARGGRRPGVRATSVLVAVTVLTAVLVGSAVALVALLHRSLLSGLDSQVSARARDVAAAATSGQLGPVVSSPGEDASLVQVLGPGGTVVSATANIQGEPPLIAAGAVHTAPGTERLTNLPIGSSQEIFRGVSVSVGLDGGTGQVVVAASTAPVDTAVRRVEGLLILGLPAVLAVSGLVVWWVLGRTLRPVERIRDQAAQVGAGDLSTRVPVPAGRDEIARLAVTMNDMLARLEEASVRQRQFVGDASHELRSPLTAVRAQVEVLLAHPDPTASAQVLQHVQVETGRMSQLIDDLLFLAAVTEGHPPTTPVDLDEVVLTEISRAGAQAQVTLELLGPTAARVDGAERDLGRLLRNLLDNAVTYARTQVTVSLVTEGSQAVLAVTDDGPGIPLEHRDAVFARFARTDAARHRPSRGAGAGLGLAIALEIARAHGGSLAVSQAPGGPGAQFTLRLPLSNGEGKAQSRSFGGPDSASSGKPT